MFNTLAIQAVPASHPLSGPLQEELAALAPDPPGAPPSWKGSVPPSVKCRTAKGLATVNFTMAGSIESLSFSKGGEWYHLMDLRYITSHLPQECKDADCPSPVPGAWTPELLGFWSDVTVESTGSC